MKETIHLFIWGYQQHFAAGVKLLAKRVMELIGAPIEPWVRLPAHDPAIPWQHVGDFHGRGRRGPRLARQGTRIAPTPLTDELLDRASRIDGTILVDPQGVCHAIVVILDGGASDASTPSRGARYNSAVRYVEGTPGPRLAIVVSDDKTTDLLPLLRPRLARTAIEAALSAFEAATRDDLYQPQLFLDENRFYLDAAQCYRANAALKRLETLPKKSIWIITRQFAPDPEMDPSYLK